MNHRKSSFKKNLVIVIGLLVLSLIVLLFMMGILLSIKDKDEFSGSSDSCLSKAKEYYNKEYYDLAEEKVRECIRKEPDNSESISWLARVLIAQNRNTEAIKQYEKLVKLKPDDVDIRIAVSSLYDEEQDFEPGIKHLKIALTHAPKSEIVNNNLCWMLSESKKYKEGLPYCQEAIKLAPDQAYIIDSMGYVVAGLGDTDQAIEYYQEAISIEPDLGEVYLHLGDAYLHEGKKDLAIENYKKFLKLDPKHKQAKETTERLKTLTES